MLDEILSEKQKELLPLLGKFSNSFSMIGGTAIALQLGHRRSVDFDLATKDILDPRQFREIIDKKNTITDILVDHMNEYSIIVNDVRITFIKYPFDVEFTENFKDIIKMPDILTLASMKAYALGRRAKWKDYVDLYFIFQDINFKDVVDKSKKLFGNEFNEKLFREQLIYYDVDYTEKVVYMPGFETKNEEIKQALTSISLQKT